MTEVHEHEWVVFSTALHQGWLMLQCVGCGAQGTIDHPSKEEWGQAFHAPSKPYRWLDASRVTGRHRKSTSFYVVPRQAGSNCGHDCPHRREVGDYERVPAEIIHPGRTLSDDEHRELLEWASYVEGTDLRSTFFPVFVEGFQADTGNEPSGALRYIAQQIDAIHQNGLHFRPAIVAFVLRELARLNWKEQAE